MFGKVSELFAVIWSMDSNGRKGKEAVLCLLCTLLSNNERPAQFSPTSEGTTCVLSVFYSWLCLYVRSA